MTGTSCFSAFPFRLAVIFSLALFLPACGGTFSVKDFAKSEIDAVADVHLQEVNGLLESLLVKLYKRNPRELRKTPGATIAERQATLQGSLEEMALAYRASRQKRAGDRSVASDGGDASLSLVGMRRALDPAFKGDRVFALVQGLCGMIAYSYNHKSEFFVLDQLNEQRLYNSARNIEVLSWRLRSQYDSRGRLLLLTNSLEGEAYNLSFERLFGKLIQLQDTMAIITAGRSRRTLVYVTKNVASMAFMPL